MPVTEGCASRRARRTSGYACLSPGCLHGSGTAARCGMRPLRVKATPFRSGSVGARRQQQKPRWWLGRHALECVPLRSLAEEGGRRAGRRSRENAEKLETEHVEVGGGCGRNRLLIPKCSANLRANAPSRLLRTRDTRGRAQFGRGVHSALGAQPCRNGLHGTGGACSRSTGEEPCGTTEPGMMAGW